MVKRRIANIILCFGIIFSSFAVSVSPVHAEDILVPDGYTRAYGYYEKTNGYIEDYYFSLPSGSKYVNFIAKDGNTYQLYSFIVTTNFKEEPFAIYRKYYLDAFHDNYYSNSFSVKDMYNHSDSKCSHDYISYFNKKYLYYLIYSSFVDYGYRLSKDVKIYDLDKFGKDVKYLGMFACLDTDAIQPYEIKLPPATVEPWLPNWYFSSPSIADIAVFAKKGYPTTGYYSTFSNDFNGETIKPTPEPAVTPTPSNTPSPTVTPKPSEKPEPTSTPVIVIPDIKVPTDYVHENVFVDWMQKLKSWLSDGFNAVKNAIENISISKTVNNAGKSIWDFLSELVDAITHIADRIADGITGIIGALFKGLGQIFVPSSDQVSELKSKVSDLKAQTGFFGQSFDVVKQVGESVSSGLVSGDNTFKWDALALFGHDVIPAGSLNLDEYSSSLGFSAIHTLIKTLLSGILAWNTILFVYRRFRKVFKV